MPASVRAAPRHPPSAEIMLATIARLTSVTACAVYFFAAMVSASGTPIAPTGM